MLDGVRIEGKIVEVNKWHIHRLSVTGFLEYFRGHVAWRSACCGQDMELLFVHYSRETKVGDEEICIVFGSSEQEVFRFEVTVNYTVVVKVGNCGQGCADEICSIGFVVGAFAAYTIEELTA